MICCSQITSHTMHRIACFHRRSAKEGGRKKKKKGKGTLRPVVQNSRGYLIYLNVSYDCMAHKVICWSHGSTCSVFQRGGHSGWQSTRQEIHPGMLHATVKHVSHHLLPCSYKDIKLAQLKSLSLVINSTTSNWGC